MVSLLLALALGGSDAAPAPGDEVTVMVMRQYLFPTPAFYARPLAELELGQELIVLQVSGQWLEAAASSLTGWVHMTAVTGADAGSGTVASGSGSVSADEVTLAGRGFNSEIEAAYASDNPELDFDAVDLIEGFEVSEADMVAFLGGGALVPADQLPVIEAEEQESTPSSDRTGGGR
jgi:hypothetical protein